MLQAEDIGKGLNRLILVNLQLFILLSLAIRSSEIWYNVFGQHYRHQRHVILHHLTIYYHIITIHLEITLNIKSFVAS